MVEAVVIQISAVAVPVGLWRDLLECTFVLQAAGRREDLEGVQEPGPSEPQHRDDFAEETQCCKKQN